MSLVNLSHVCSHLQNASLARLGLTSIPYTRMHLSLALLLQKQGFFSQVKLGGPSPPASCFPAGTIRDRLTKAEESNRYPNAAEHEIEEIHVWKSKEQLSKDGWDSHAANFLMQHEGKAQQESELTEEISKKEIEIIKEHAPLLAEVRANVRAWMPEPEAADPQETLQQRQRRDRERLNLENFRVKSQLLREGFSQTTLMHFAGPNRSRRTYRDLERDGITISAMGLDIHNQPWKPPITVDADEGVVTQENRSTRRLWLGLKYWDGVPVLRKAKMLSKPTKRIWLSAQELGGLVRGKGAFKEQIKPLTQVGEVMVISTDKGLMEVRECVERKIGGMVLCRIW
jgi:ribosomal protein S8